MISSILFFVPINLFDGEVHFNINGNKFVSETKMSLSYFIGLWLPAEQLKDVESFNLTKGGWALAIIFTIGFPALLAYRAYLKKTKVN